jgi:hypothetical protein
MGSNIGAVTMRDILATIGLWTLAAGCADITHVQDPTAVLPPDIQTPAGAANVRVGALSDVFLNLGNQAVASGLFVDEFTVASAANSSPDDQRDLSVSQPGGYPYAGMSDGRNNALIAINLLKQYAPQPTWHIGELYALVAAVELDYAEDLCDGVPLAVIQGYTPSYGPTYTRQQLLSHVLLDLDSAAAYSGGTDSIANLAAVLRGRAFSNSADLASAASAVQNVPVGFAYTGELSDTTALNAIYSSTVLNGAITVSDREGINGLPFVSAADPRLPIVTLSVNGNTINSIGTVSNGSAPLTLASGIEGQLLQAEYALSAGQTTAWAATLNNLRQNAITPAMSALPADSTTGASPSLQLAVMFRERAFWLFGTGHREGDVRRLVRQYGLPANSVYPIGPYLGGPATYGSSVVELVPGEQYDPNYHGCTNYNP